jgi:hypothetical protein
MRLRITYSRPRDLVADHDQQLRRNGVLVRVAPPADLALFAPVELELVSPIGRCAVTAQVIQTLGGAGIAVGFDSAAAAEIAALVRAASAAPDRAGEPPRHEVVDEPAADDESWPEDDPATDDDAGPDGADAAPEPADGGRAASDLHTRLRSATAHEKMQIALHGNKDERGLIIRDPNAKLLHQYVLKNPKLQLDEVATIAALRTVSAEVLKYIAGRREWAQRPEIAAALVRNPKTPVPLAVRLVPFLSVTDLRQLAKAPSTRAPILREVRKKVL